MTVVSFTGYTPPPRYDAQSWTQARIEEAPAATGPWTIVDTKALVADIDPANPAARSFTTELATLADGWYRVVWLDAQGDASPPTEPVHNIAGGGAMPTVDEVAALLKERTWADAVQVGTFRDDTAPGAGDGTTPTATEAQQLIDLAVEDVLIALGGSVPPGYEPRARHLAKLRAATLIEASFFRRDVDAGTSPYAQYQAMYLAALKQLQAIPEVGAAVGSNSFASLPLRSTVTTDPLARLLP